MNVLAKIDMMELTRLTREGRLKEAMAVLRGLHPSTPLSDGLPEDDARREPAAATPQVLDMLAPSAGTGDSWTAPRSEATPAAGGPEGMSGWQNPGALRQFVERMVPSRSARGSKGLFRPPAERVPDGLPDGALFEERSYANESGSRSYKLYVPSGHNGQLAPLVIMLHGCTQSPDDFAAGTRMNDLAEAQTFLVAYPAQAQSANGSKCWNWFSTGDQQRDLGEPSLIAGITRQILHDFRVDPARVYVAGLSAGGAAAAIMGSRYRDLYAAIGVHSGLACGAASDLSSAFAAMRQGGSSAMAGSLMRGGYGGTVPTIVFHGDGDKTVNPVNGDQVIAQSKAAADFQTTIHRGEAPGGIRYTRSVHADESGRPMLEQWVLHGAGHAWSGGSAAGSYTEPRGPDASRAMMRFFLQHSNTAASAAADQ